MIHEAQLPTIPAAVALNSDTKEIAFNKVVKGAFIDSLDNLPTATWHDSFLSIMDASYDYNKWHPVEGQLGEYFKRLIQKDAVPAGIFENPFGI